MLVSVIIPTMPSRAAWLPKAIECAKAQIGVDVEVLIDDGPGTIGEKRNRLCERAQGEFIAHFDDDDLSAPNRLADQIERCADSGKAVTGYHSVIFSDGVKRWKYLGTRDWAFDASLCYWREFWQKHPFDEINDGLEYRFRHAAITAGQFISADAGELMEISIHPENTGARVIGEGWIEL